MPPTDNSLTSNAFVSSVSEWVQRLKDDDPAAARKLWQRYWCQLVAVAKRQIGTRPRRSTDEEDVAQEAFEAFFRAAKAGRFPDLNDRHDLWQVLLRFTENRLLDRWKHERRQKRGGGKVRGDSVFGNPVDGHAGMDAIPAMEPSPEFALEASEDLELLLGKLGDATLQRVALLKLQGFLNEEIAKQLGVVPDTVGRKLRLIREKWANLESAS